MTNEKIIGHKKINVLLKTSSTKYQYVNQMKKIYSKTVAHTTGT